MPRKQLTSQIEFTREMLPLDKTTPRILAEYRKMAWETFQRLPYPTLEDEDWRRTSLRSLNMDELQLVNGKTSDIQQDEIAERFFQPLTEQRQGGQAILSPEGLSIDLTPELAEKGVVFTDLETAAREHPSIVEKILGKIIDPEDGKFAALTGAFAKHGIFVYIPKGLEVVQTLHSIFLAASDGFAQFYNLMIYLDEGASLTYAHETSSLEDGQDQALTGENLEIYLGPGANLKFIELQTLSRNVWSFGHKKVQVDKDGKLDWVIGTIGSHMTKHFASVDLVGQGAESRVTGMFFANSKQHLSYKTQQNHLAPRTYSNLLCKGALTETGRSVWRGMIYVAPEAKNADGYQANRNLLLSEGARATSIPGLEILNDEVRCSHGSTVGKIDLEQMFYLQARGIPRPEAERLIVHGFFEDVLSRIPLDRVKERLEQSINRKLI